MKLEIGISHAPHMPGRKESLARLLPSILGRQSVHLEDRPGHHSAWSLLLWKGVLAAGDANGATHAMFLQDDVIPCDSFLDNVHSVIEAKPTNLINLYNAHPLSVTAKEMGFSWCTSPDGLIGNAYILPIEMLREFVEYRTTKLSDAIVQEGGEDRLINLFAMDRGYLVWSTVPALVDHDLTVPSTNTLTQFKSPVVPPDNEPHDWTGDAIHTGRVFRGNHSLLIDGSVKHDSMDDRKRLVRRYYELAGDIIR